MALANEAKFAVLFERFRQPIWLYCRRRIGADRADDVMGDVYLTAWRRIDKAPEGDAALPWLYRIAHLTVLIHRRSMRRSVKLNRKVAGHAMPRVGPVVDQVVMRDEVARVVRLVEQMSESDAEILRLVAWEQLSTEQIAAVLDVSKDVAKKRLSRARKRLTKLYGQNKIKHSPGARKEVSGEY